MTRTEPHNDPGTGRNVLQAAWPDRNAFLSARQPHPTPEPAPEDELGTGGRVMTGPAVPQYPRVDALETADQPVPYALTAKADALLAAKDELDAGPGRGEAEAGS
jgi:hypothetical protein